MSKSNLQGTLSIKDLALTTLPMAICLSTNISFFHGRFFPVLPVSESLPTFNLIHILKLQVVMIHPFILHYHLFSHSNSHGETKQGRKKIFGNRTLDSHNSMS
jgi:hypothetical protein